MKIAVGFPNKRVTLRAAPAGITRAGFLNRASLRFELEALMALKNAFIAVTCAVLLGWSGVSIADEYRPDQFLGLDLSRAVLSPKRLGPTAEFEPVPVQASDDRESKDPLARAEPTAEPRLHNQSPRIADLPVEEPQVRVVKPRVATRVKPARRHGNPLDAQALDTRIQVWPCRSGGICNWKR
jgi:hypothetical protein